jgi:flagellar biosynthesis protein FlhB
MADDLGEKTEQPSAKKLSDSRGRGMVPKSTDLSAAIELGGGAILLAVFGAALVESMGGVLRRVLEEDMSGRLDALTVARQVFFVTLEGALALLPFMGVMVLLAWLSHVVQFGVLFTTHPLEPKLDRLDPIKGAGRLLGMKNIAKTLVNTVKLSAVLAVGYFFLRGRIDEVTMMPALPMMAGIKALLELAVDLSIWLLVVLLIIGLADLAYQKWQHIRDLRMSKQEVQDERRSMDGDPDIKRRRIILAREIAMQRVGQQVPEADVIVTNPTHFSVAIKYDPETMRAPRVVAKGVDFLAMRIRQVAMLHEVSIVERPPLARGLYYGVDEGREIPLEFYQAVAEVLAHVYRLEQRAGAAAAGASATA